MAFDLKQMMSAFLTFSMFVMLGNMIKRDHIDPLLGSMPESQTINYDVIRVSKTGMVKLSEISYGPWKEHYEPAKPCWQNPSIKAKEERSHGYIYFSLTNGPEFHASQVANAVQVARRLGATLALPDIKGSKLGEKRFFGEIYDVNNFVTSLNGVVRVDKNPPPLAKSFIGRLPVLRIPDRVSGDFIDSEIEPIFSTKRNLRIITYFNSSSMRKATEKALPDANQCLAMFQSLRLKAELQELVDSMVGTLRSLSQKTRGRFVAVDLRVEMLLRKSCKESSDISRPCYNGEELAEFLHKIGFHSDTTVYLTQTRWHSSLNSFRDAFPNTFTKDAIMPADSKVQLMDEESHEVEKLIDSYLCEQGDVFVPAYASRFYASVVGQRIASGKTQVYVPAKKTDSALATDYVSPYIQKKSHYANSCFC